MILQLSRFINCTHENLTGECIPKWLTARVVLTSVAKTCVTATRHSVPHFLLCTLHKLPARARQSGSLRAPNRKHPSALVSRHTRKEERSRGKANRATACLCPSLPLDSHSWRALPRVPPGPSASSSAPAGGWG